MIWGAAGGVSLWIVARLAFPYLPPALSFYVTAFALIFGCGALLLSRWAQAMAPWERTALACAVGIATAPLVMAVFAVCHASFLFAPLAFVTSGAMAVRWWRLRQRDARPHDRLETWSAIAVTLLVFAVAAWTSNGRMRTTFDSVLVYGDYETFDLTFYAGIAAGLNDTTVFPPPSPFYADHRIVYSYFPLMLLARIHQVGGVSLLAAFLTYGWPLFAGIAAAALMAFFRRLGSLPFALVSTLLVFLGSSLAYLAVWFAPAMLQGGDTLIWSSMFLAPSAEWLYFNPWTPALIVLAAGLYATSRLDDVDGRAWALLAGFCFGQLFMFKSFATPIIVGALAVSTAIALVRRHETWRRLAGVTIGTVLWTAPWVAIVLPYNRQENRGARVTVEYLSLVRRMLRKMDLTGPIADFVHRHIGADPDFRILLTIASVIFLIGGFGMRCLGLAGVARASVGSASWRAWTPLAWIAILGVALPFFVAIAPFPNSIQTYQMGLFVLWPFAARVIWAPKARPGVGRLVATAALILISIPSTMHYVAAAHAAPAGPVFTHIEPGGLQILRRLRGLDPRLTRLIQSNPLWPSLYVVESERPALLAWSGYVEEEGLPEVDGIKAGLAAFFGSQGQPGVDDVSLLRRYDVTHVIERVTTDQIHPHVLAQLTLVSGSPEVRLYEVPLSLRR